MELLFNPFDNLLCILLGISFTVWFTLLLVFIIVPAIFGVSFGIRRLYMKTLLKIFEVRDYCILAHYIVFLTKNKGSLNNNVMLLIYNKLFLVCDEDVIVNVFINIKKTVAFEGMLLFLYGDFNNKPPTLAKHPAIEQTIDGESWKMCSRRAATVMKADACLASNHFSSAVVLVN